MKAGKYTVVNRGNHRIPCEGCCFDQLRGYPGNPCMDPGVSACTDGGLQPADDQALAYLAATKLAGRSVGDG